MPHDSVMRQTSAFDHRRSHLLRTGQTVDHKLLSGQHPAPAAVRHSPG